MSGVEGLLQWLFLLEETGDRKARRVQPETFAEDRGYPQGKSKDLWKPPYPGTALGDGGEGQQRPSGTADEDEQYPS